MNPFNFEQAMARLNAISQKLEDDALPLDEAIKLFEEGLELSKQCQTQLNTYENTVKEMVLKHRNDANA